MNSHLNITTVDKYYSNNLEIYGSQRKLKNDSKATIEDGGFCGGVRHQSPVLPGLVRLPGGTPRTAFPTHDLQAGLHMHRLGGTKRSPTLGSIRTH